MGITLLVVVSLGHSRELGFKWLVDRPVFPEVRKLNNLPFRNSCQSHELFGGWRGESLLGSLF